MIPEEHKLEVMQNGIAFVRSITAAYGGDDGISLFDRICEVLDPDLKGELFFAMLTGIDNQVTVVGFTGSDRIALIKAIREITGLGLKESKDLSDTLSPPNYRYNSGSYQSVMAGPGKPITLKLKDCSRSDAVRKLAQIGAHCK